MAVQTVFSSNLDPSLENLTTRFTNATGFYILAPFLNAELEIDVFLQVYFPTDLGEQVRNLPLGKIEEQAILLNITDTQSLVTIPSEYLDTGLEMALLFLASSITFLQVVVISPECSLASLCDSFETRFTALEARLNGIETALQELLTTPIGNGNGNGNSKPEPEPEPEPVETISQPATPENFFIFI